VTSDDADDRWVQQVHDLANATLKAAHKRGAKPLINEILDIGNALRGDATVAVIGRRSFGKSRLLAALVGAEVTPSQTDVATNTYIQIEHAAGAPRALVHFSDPEREAEEIPLDRLPEYAVIGGEHAGDVAYVRVLVDTPVLRDGLRLIDTPGLGGSDRAHEEITLRVLEDADALLLVLDAEQPVTDDEREVLRRAREHVAHVVIVANKAEGEHAEQLAFNVDALGEPILPVSAMLAIEAETMRAADPDAYAMVREHSGLDALEAALRAMGSAVRRDRYTLLLERASAALDDLTAPDREQVELARDGSDPAERLREVAAELEQLSRLNPASEVNVRTGHLRQELVDRFRASVSPAFREIKERVGQQWEPAMAATLPVTLETVTKTLWADALSDLRRQGRRLAADLDRELSLGVKARVALLELARGSNGELPTTYQPGDEVPPPLDPSTRTEAAMRRSMRVTMTAGAANLALAPLIPLAGIPGLNLVVLPLALPLGLYLGRRENQAMRSRASRQAALGYVSECQAAAAGLANALAARVSRLGEDLGRQYQQRWLARRETLTRTATQLKSAGVDVRSAQARLDELAPLLRSRDELQG
jgi:small GTP-binding protein